MIKGPRSLLSSREFLRISEQEFLLQHNGQMFGVTYLPKVDILSRIC